MNLRGVFEHSIQGRHVLKTSSSLQCVRETSRWRSRPDLIYDAQYGNFSYLPPPFLFKYSRQPYTADLHVITH